MIDFLCPIWEYKGMKLQITGGVVEFDDEELEKISQYKWHVNDMGYAVWRGIENGVKRTVRMHRHIMGTPKGLVTDHVNHNPLDNRKENLRICTQSENMRNRRDQGKGYWFQRQNKNWVVEIHGIHRGTFETELEASKFASLVRSGLIEKKPKVIPTHCSYGHSLEDAYFYNGSKHCKPCQRRRSKEYNRRKYAN